MIELKLKESQKPLLSIHHSVEPITWTTFVSLQLLDIYTTHRGLKYDCVMETNPVFGKQPSVGKMLITKSAILAPAIKSDLKYQRLTQEDMTEINSFMFLIIMNNLYVTHQAKKNCYSM